MKRKRNGKSVPHEETIADHLRKNPEEAAEYLNTALTDDDPRVFLLALRDVTKAYGGMKNAAEKAKLNRESLYKSLSGKRNPRLNNITTLLGALGFQVQIRPKASNRVSRKRKSPSVPTRS